MKKYILLFICVILLSGCILSFAEASVATYHPYPIIFVHGIDPGSWNSFKGARDNLDIYFYDPAAKQYKYFHTNMDGYFPKCNYPNNGDIPASAETVLRQSIITARLSYPPEVPMEDRKVIIVAHSMGGLVVRSLLKQYPLFKDKIDKVIFIGTPHHGAPGASAVWIMNKIKREALGPIINEYVIFHSQNAGIRRVFADQSSMLIVAGQINNELTAKLQSYKGDIDWDLGKFSAFGPDPNGIALEQLRLDGDVTYHKVIESAYKNLKQSISIDASITGSNTFLGRAGSYLSNPNKYFSMVGIYNQGHANITAWEIRKLRDKYEPDFTFPALSGQEQSISNAATDGDGIVTSQSQMGIGGPVITIAAHHIDEAKHWNTILAAIDDVPQIESVYAVPCNWNDNSWDYYYIIMKVKEYLLADVEIESISLNDDPANIDLTGFSTTPGTPPYKPYIKFGKNFLTERLDPNIRDKNNNVIQLKPGEFYVKAYFPDRGYGSPPIYTYDLTYKFKIVLKNPANKTKDETIFICRPKADCYWSTYCIDVPPYFEDGGISTSTTISHLDISSGSSSKVSVKVGMCGSGSHTPFLTFPERDVDLHSNGNYFEGNVKDYATWDGSNGSGGTVAQGHDYNVKVNIYPYDVYANPITGDYKMDIPTFVFPYYSIVRADPTFIQSHRSYSHLAKFNTRKIFEQYGYCLSIRKLNANENISLSVKAEEKSPNIKTLIAYQYLLPDYLSNEYRTQFDSINRAVSQNINEAVIKIIAIENNFDVEKEKLISNAESESGNNVNIIEALMDNKAPQESISRIEEQNEQLKSQLVTQALEKLKNIKDIQISTIIKETNALVAALINKETPRAIASSVVFR